MGIDRYLLQTSTQKVLEVLGSSLYTNESGGMLLVQIDERDVDVVLSLSDPLINPVRICQD